MKLIQLAFACHVYAGMTGYDKSYRDFQSVVSTPLALLMARERTELLKWLNQWGCRQFAKSYHAKASREIPRWFGNYERLLAKPFQDLMHLSQKEIDQAEVAFQALSESFASERSNGPNAKIRVRVGPTGAAKILFALRPEAYPPWDIQIRDAISDKGTTLTYKAFLHSARKELAELQIDCSRLHIDLKSVPRLIRRSDSTLAKLVDEYNWVTVSNKCVAPSIEDFEEWARWL